MYSIGLLNKYMSPILTIQNKNTTSILLNSKVLVRIYHCLSTETSHHSLNKSPEIMTSSKDVGWRFKFTQMHVSNTELSKSKNTTSILLSSKVLISIYLCLSAEANPTIILQTLWQVRKILIVAWRLEFNNQS